MSAMGNTQRMDASREFKEVVYKARWLCCLYKPYLQTAEEAVISQKCLEWSRTGWSLTCHRKESFKCLAIPWDFASVREGVATDLTPLSCDTLSSLVSFPLRLSIAKNSIPHMGCMRTGYLFANGPLDAVKTAHPLFRFDLWPVWWFCQQGVTPCQVSLWFLWPGHLSSMY